MPVNIIEHGKLYSPDYQENNGKNFYCQRCGCYFSATDDHYEKGLGTIGCTCPECMNFVVREEDK